MFTQLSTNIVVITIENKKIREEMKLVEIMYFIIEWEVIKKYFKKHGGSRKKVQIELQYDPTILFMNIYPKESKAYPKEIYPHGSITHKT